MTTRIGTLTIGIFLFFFAAAAQADEAVSLKVGYLLLAPEGKLAIEEKGFGTRIDLDDDLDMDDSTGLTLEAALAFGDFKLTAAYQPISFEGDSVLARPVYFNGKFYDFRAPIASSLELDILDIGLTWFLLNIDDLPVRFQLGPEIAVKIVDARASLSEKTSGITEEASETLPFPTLGLRGRVALSDFVGISGRIGYIGYDDNYFFDSDIQVELSPLPFVGVFAGYRYLDIAIDESDLFVDTQMAGFYGGASVRF